MLNYKKIKLVIFDLDNTLWNGLVSEDDVTLFSYTNPLIKSLIDNGIVVSICSKNNYDKAFGVLKKHNLHNYFVFSSIDWNSKGPRVASMLKNMGLRDENALFIDDRIENCKEVAYYNPKIQTLLANNINMNELLKYYSKQPALDKKHSKLTQYKELELREKNKNYFVNNEDFLFDSNIVLKINRKDISELERIHELVLKTNQLNFTKVRSSYEELVDDLNKSEDWGTIYVKDKYSYYGLIGFYCIINSKFKHFLFSCRTIGMGIEQYIYEKMNFLYMHVVEPTSIKLTTKRNKVPWVKEVDTFKEIKEKNTKNKARLLFKGPCDLSVISGYLENNGNKIDVEFTFQDTFNRSVEHQNVIENIVGTKYLNDNQKKYIENCLPFGHPEIFKTNLFSRKYDAVVLSTFADFTIPTYYSKKKEIYYSCGQYNFSLCEKDNWGKYKTGEIYSGGFTFTDESLNEFSKEFVYIGVDPKRIYDNIKLIRDLLPKETLLMITIGSNTPYMNEANPVYFETAKMHNSLHDLLKSRPIKNVIIIDPNPIIEKIGQASFTNNINHFTKQIYINMAEQISYYLTKNNLKSFKIKANRRDWVARLKRKFREWLSKKQMNQ